MKPDRQKRLRGCCYCDNPDCRCAKPRSRLAAFFDALGDSPFASMGFAIWPDVDVEVRLGTPEDDARAIRSDWEAVLGPHLKGYE